MMLRCAGRIHGIVESGTIEVKCRSKSCGARSGVVVLHYFDLHTGDLIETKSFADPANLFEERNNIDCSHCA